MKYLDMHINSTDHPYLGHGTCCSKASTSPFILEQEKTKVLVVELGLGQSHNMFQDISL